MAGIYIHIPFCRKACHYCDFHFSTDLAYIDRMVNAISTEITLRKGELKESISTIYFGGGTPSVLKENHLEKLLKGIEQNYILNDSIEITLETNPDDIDKESLTSWKKLGINRLSIGIQSFIEEDLEWMNRSHTVEQAKKAVLLARELGFNNITIDLIYGIPNLSASDWESNLNLAVQLNPDHISAYCLTIEPKTVFGHRYKKGEMKAINDEDASDQFIVMRNLLAQQGFAQYEVSNFSKSGFESKHNSSYWQGKNYFGFGPSAHSYDGKTRRWNVSNNFNYLKGIEEGADYFEEEELSDKDKLNETIMISLRTIRGIDLSLLESNFKLEKKEELISKAKKYLDSKHLTIEESNLKATETGLLLIDKISAELFF